MTTAFDRYTKEHIVDEVFESVENTRSGYGVTRGETFQLRFGYDLVENVLQKLMTRSAKLVSAHIVACTSRNYRKKSVDVIRRDGDEHRRSPEHPEVAVHL